MCGIVGFAGTGWGPDADRHRLLETGCGQLRHRGPDDEGRFLRPAVALGMRRLSVIDLEGGHQPVANEDGTVHVVFNGEIYNHESLRRDLEREGHVFTSRCDTEVLVHLYEEEGEALVRRLRGMFAFALWDAKRQRLLLARDRLGIKPLYCWQPDGNRFAFASELNALSRQSSFTEEIDPSAVARYLALGYVPSPYGIYRNTTKLRPGHLLVWESDGSVRTRRYWSPVVPEDPGIDEVTAAREIRRLLLESVQLRLMSDVPLGAFLSGGLDSSAVVAAMARLSDNPPRTFSIGFTDPEYDEAPDARRVADYLGTKHTELTVGSASDLDLAAIVGRFDEPFADSSAIPTYLVSQLAGEHVTVSLSGDGGDELFGGYRRYRNLLRRDIPLPRLTRRLLRSVGRTLPQGAYGRNRILEYSRTTRGRYAGLVADPLSASEGGLARADLHRDDCSLDRLLDPWFEEVAPAERDPATTLMLVDTLTYLPDDILTKVDRMSMAVSLESRVPLLDHELVEFAFRLPGHFKVSGASSKRVFRRAIEGLVPSSVFEKKKQGFSVPLRAWLRSQLRGHLAKIARLDSAGVFEYVDGDALSRMIAEHESGRRDHSGSLWKVLVLAQWLNRNSYRSQETA